MGLVYRRILRQCLESFLHIISSFVLLKNALSNLLPFLFHSVFVFRDLFEILCDQLEMCLFRLSACKEYSRKMDCGYEYRKSRVQILRWIWLTVPIPEKLRVSVAGTFTWRMRNRMLFRVLSSTFYNETPRWCLNPLMQVFPSTFFTAVAILDDLTTFFLLSLWTWLEHLSSATDVGSSVISASPTPTGLVVLSSGPSYFSDLWLSKPFLLWSYSICLLPSLQYLSYSTEFQNQCALSQPSIVLNAWVEAEWMRNRFFFFNL